MREWKRKTVNLYVFIICWSVALGLRFVVVVVVASLHFAVCNQFEEITMDLAVRNDHHRKSQQTMRKRYEKRAFMVINGAHSYQTIHRTRSHFMYHRQRQRSRCCMHTIVPKDGTFDRRSHLKWIWRRMVFACVSILLLFFFFLAVAVPKANRGSRTI